MPDWSYHTVLRPAASLLPRGTVRPLVLNALAAIARLPGGGTFIHLLGYMDPPAVLAREVAGIAVSSPVGLGGGVDPDGVAREAFARFGFGVIELGPYALGSAGTDPPPLTRRPAHARLLIRFVLSENEERALTQLRDVLRPIAEHIDGVCLTLQDARASDAFLERAAAVCRSAGIGVLDESVIRRGMSTPRQIVDAIAAGASLVLVDTGFLVA